MTHEILAVSQDAMVGIGGVVVAAVSFGLSYRRSAYSQMRKDLEGCKRRYADLNERNIELMARVIELENKRWRERRGD